MKLFASTLGFCLLAGAASAQNGPPSVTIGNDADNPVPVNVVAPAPLPVEVREDGLVRGDWGAVEVNCWFDGQNSGSPDGAQCRNVRDFFGAPLLISAVTVSGAYLDTDDRINGCAVEAQIKTDEGAFGAATVASGFAQVSGPLNLTVKLDPPIRLEESGELRVFTSRIDISRFNFGRCFGRATFYGRRIPSE